MKQAFLYNAVITTAKIEDLAVTNAKINDLNATKINAGFISADRIETGSIDAKIATIGNAQIADAAITNAKIGTAAVDTLKIAGNAVTVPSFFSTTGQINNIQNSYITILTGAISYSREQPLVFTLTTGVGGGQDDSNLNSVAVTLDMEIQIRSTTNVVLATKQVTQAVTIPPAAVSSVSGATVFFPSEISQTSVLFYLRAKMVENPTFQRRGLFARAPSTVILETKR
jgi:hypothetical protein